MAIHRLEVSQSLDQSIKFSRQKQREGQEEEEEKGNEKGKKGVRVDVHTSIAQKGDQLSAYVHTCIQTYACTDNHLQQIHIMCYCVVLRLISDTLRALHSHYNDMHSRVQCSAQSTP